MILFFHNILNKVTSSTLDLGTKKSSCLHQATTHSKVQHSGYKWPQVLCIVADYEEMHCGSKTECLLFLFFSFMVRNDFCVTVQLRRPCWIEIIYKKNVIRMKTKNNNIPYMPLLEGQALPRLRIPQCLQRIMYTLYKQYL